MSLQYVVRHVTRVHYEEPVRESLMELRMQPRSEDHQICLSFELDVQPPARVQSFRDYLGNTVHYFDQPKPHQDLVITAVSRVQLQPPPAPPNQLDPAAWEELERFVREGEYFDFLTPTAATQGELGELQEQLGAVRRGDPLTLLRELNQALYESFRYVPDSTRVDSPLEQVIHTREGVCQDFAHLFIALARELHVPCRYVSGYLYHREGLTSLPDASHAWVEAYLPSLGWLGFDPTNNLLAGERHIRTAVGRDYNDVPPNRGTHKGGCAGQVSAAVQVRLAGQPLGEDRFYSLSGEAPELPATPGWYSAQQQQQ